MLKSKSIKNLVADYEKQKEFDVEIIQSQNKIFPSVISFPSFQYKNEVHQKRQKMLNDKMDKIAYQSKNLTNFQKRNIISSNGIK